VPEENLYIRTSTTLPSHTIIPNGSITFFLHTGTNADERDTTGLLLRPEFSIQAYLFGATPSTVPLPAENPYTLGMPDIWVKVADLVPGERYGLSRPSPECDVQLYTESPDGSLLAVASGSRTVAAGSGIGSLSFDFTAQPGSVYFLRITIVSPWVRDSWEYTNHMILRRVTTPPPANDNWTDAIVISSPVLEPVTGDLRGATASIAEAYVLAGTPPAPAVLPRYRSVWYALDLPAGDEDFGVTAWGADVTLFNISAEGELTELPAGASASLPVFRPDGTRRYAMVQGASDRFLLMLAPITRAGDIPDVPLPLTTGARSRYFPNWATADPAEEVPAIEGTTWHIWTAPSSGRYHLSSLGSAYNAYSYSIRIGPAPVIGAALPLDYYAGYSAGMGAVMVFEAAADTTYLICTRARKDLGGPAVLRISPAEGASPYTFWQQSRPAWEDSLGDPLGDPDGDGANNLLELATGQHPGLHNALPYGVRILNPPQPAGIELYVKTLATSFLSGPPGCIPFVLSMERSPDLETWENLGPYLSAQTRLLEGEPFQYLRLRISR
jgi:hypothetical protein